MPLDDLSEVKYFDDDENRHWPQRSLQIYQVLIGCALRRQTIRYMDLAEIFGFGGAGVFAWPLGLIMRWCEWNELPPLTVIVVNTDGVPGDGLVTPENVDYDREQVFKEPWYRIYPPTPSELEAFGEFMDGFPEN